MSDMNILRKAIFVGAALASFYSNHSDGAEVTWSRQGDGTAVITLSGPIRTNDTTRLYHALGDVLEAGLITSSVRLNSGGGYVDEGYELAGVVRRMNLATVVDDNGKCASACFLIFAAGTKKTASVLAKIGVHSASDGAGSETIGTAATTVQMARYVEKLGVPASITGRMVTTRPEYMAWLSRVELLSMGVDVTEPASGAISQRPLSLFSSPPKPELSESTSLAAPLPETPVNPYLAEEAQWKKYQKQAIAASASTDVESRPRKVCERNDPTSCISVIPYLERTRRYAEAVEVTKNGEPVQRMTCRQTYEEDSYRVCTDFISEQNTAYVRTAKGWAPRKIR